jgi:hypothetical protein
MVLKKPILYPLAFEPDPVGGEEFTDFGNSARAIEDTVRSDYLRIGHRPFLDPVIETIILTPRFPGVRRINGIEKVLLHHG